MAQIPTRVVPTTKVPVQTAALQSDAGASQLGQSFEDLGDAALKVKKTFDQRKQEDEQFQVQKYYLDEAARLNTDLEERKKQQISDPATFTAGVEQDYNQQHTAILNQLAASGFSRKSQQEMDLKLSALRGGMIANARQYQGQLETEKKLGDLDDSTTKLSQLMQASPEEVDHGLAAIDDLAAKSGLDAVVAERWRQRARQAATTAAGMGKALYDPESVVKALTGETTQDAATATAPGAPAPPNGDYGDTPFAAVKSRIMGTEGPQALGGYDALAYNTGKGNAAGVVPPKPLTQMTMGEVFDFQRGPMRAATRGRRGADDVGSTGAGAYQFESLTLKENAEKAFGDNWRSQPFSPANQDKVAETLWDRVKDNPKLLKNTWATFKKDAPAGQSMTMGGGGPTMDPYPDFPIVPATNAQDWDKRSDGSDKGTGFLGLRQRPDGSVSSELSVGVQINGKEMDVPTMVPGLTPKEMSWLMTTDGDQQIAGYRSGDPVAKSILQKAEAHAKQRLAEGKSVFAEQGEGPVGAPTQPLMAHDGQTGDPVLDHLDAQQRLQVLGFAREQINRSKVSTKAALEVQVSNATAAWMNGQTYNGPMPTEADFQKAYPGVESQQRFAAFQEAHQVGTFVKGMSTASASALAAQLAAMRPTDTSDPTYAVKAQAYDVAQKAASQVLASRKADPASYVLQNFPSVSTAFATANDGPSRKAAYTAMYQAYNQLGIPAEARAPMPTGELQKEVTRLDGMQPEQQVQRIAQWRDEMGPMWGQAMDQLHKAGKTTEVYAAGMLSQNPQFAQTAANILRGKQIVLQDKTRRPKDQPLVEAFQDYLGPAAQYLAPGLSAALYNSSKDLYTFHNGEVDGNDSRLFQRSVREALGGGELATTGVSSTGGKLKTILPQGVTVDQFRDWQDSLTAKAFPRFAPEAPYYAGGKQVKDKDIADDASFVMVAPGRYMAIMDSDGKPLVTRTGAPWIANITAQTVLGR